MPSFLYNALKLVTRQKQTSADRLLWKIANAVTPGSAELYYFFAPAGEPDMDELSKAEIASLDVSGHFRPYCVPYIY